MSVLAKTGVVVRCACCMLGDGPSNRWPRSGRVRRGPIRPTATQGGRQATRPTDSERAGSRAVPWRYPPLARPSLIVAPLHSRAPLEPPRPRLHTDRCLHHGVACPRPRPLALAAAAAAAPAHRQPAHDCGRRALEVQRPPPARQPQAGPRWHRCCPLPHRIVHLRAQPRRRRGPPAHHGRAPQPQQLPAA